MVPGGVFDLTAGLVAGADGQEPDRPGSRRDASRRVPRRLPPGDVVVLDLSGADVRVEGLTVRVPGNGRCGGAPGAATSSCELADLVVDAVEGEAATGVDAESPGGSVVAVVARDVVATAGEATGVMIGDGLWSLSRLQVGPVGGGLTRGADRARTHLDDRHRPAGRPDRRRRGRGTGAARAPTSSACSTSAWTR